MVKLILCSLHWSSYPYEKIYQKVLHLSLGHALTGKVTQQAENDLLMMFTQHIEFILE